jgi:hypothetical protein
MPTAALIIALIGSSFTAATEGVAFIAAVKALNHHTTAVVYHHVLKPAARTTRDVVIGRK